MSEHTRHPSAVTLSAQNLAFAPAQGFVGTPSSQQQMNVQQYTTSNGQQQNLGIPRHPTDFGRQTAKMREYEQQRSKLQQLNARGTSTANPDAMIAQMLGKPLSANIIPSMGSTVRRPMPNPGSYMFGNQAAHYPTSAPPYANQPTSDARSMAPSNYQQSTSSFFSPEIGSGAVPPSALHLTPKDLEKMMNHFAGMRMDTQGDSSHQNFKTPTTMDGVFVIPTLSNMVSPDGQLHYGPSMGAQLFSMPPWTRDKSKLPDDYWKYLRACLPPPSNRSYGGGVDVAPDTGMVYVLLRTSGLSNEILGTIWALTNRSQPGQLIKEEFFAALALVALAQETGSVASLEMLSNIVRPPIPRLSLTVLNISNVPPAVPTPSVNPLPIISNPLNSNYDQRRLSNGLIDPPKIGIVSTPAQSLPAPVSSTLSGDDFGEFTDFQASTASTPVMAASKIIPISMEEPVSSQNSDPYDALRALSDVKTNENDSNLPNVPSLPPLKKMESMEMKSTHQNNNFGDFTTNSSMMPATVSLDRILSRTTTNGDEELSSTTTSIIVRSRTEQKITSAFAVDVHKKDFNELLRQTCESLDFGSGGGNNNGGGGKSDDDVASIRSESKEPSIHSLDLQSIKQFDLDQQESADVENNNNLQSYQNRVMRSPAGSISLVDRYAAFRENGNHNGESVTVEKHVEAWTKCLEACLQLLKQADKIFAKAEDENVRREILATERGSKYLCGNVQIYRVSRRIRLSLQTMAFQSDKFIDLLTDIDTAWTHVCNYVAFSGILPKPEDLDFRNALVQINGPTNDERRKAACCGVCLLNVDATCKTDQGTNFDYKLNYGGRQYHAQCANLWINCIDSVLPALEIPCLL